MDKTNNQKSLYERFLEYSYYDLKKLFKEAKTKEEQDFYIKLADMVLQREQQKVIQK